MHPLHRKRHRRRREEAEQGKSGKISSGHGKIVAPFPEIVEIGEGKQKKQKEKNGSAEKEGSRRKLPARKRFGKDFPKGKIGESRQQKIHPGGKTPKGAGKRPCAHPQMQSGGTMQQQKEGGGPFNEGKGADLKGQSGNQTQCAHQRAEDPDVEPQPSHGKTGIRGRGLFRRFKGSFDRRALIGNVYAKFLFL